MKVIVVIRLPSNYATIYCSSSHIDGGAKEKERKSKVKGERMR